MKKTLCILIAWMMLFAVSATAFAADEGSSDTPTGFNGNGAETNVKIIAGADAKNNLSATVPLNVTLAVDKDKNIVAPTNYGIANTGAIGFHVSGVSVAVTSPYTFNATAGTNTLNLTLAAGTDTLTLADGPVTLGTAAQWNVVAGDTLSLTFDGSVGNITADITSAKQVFTVTYTLTAGLAS